MLSNHSFGSLAATPTMAYMMNSPVVGVNSVLSQAVKSSQVNASVAEQFARMQEQNQTMQRKLYNKNTESEKLQNKINKLEEELQIYKGLVDQIRHALDSGRSPVGTLDCKTFLNITKTNFIFTKNKNNLHNILTIYTFKIIDAINYAMQHTNNGKTLKSLGCKKSNKKGANSCQCCYSTEKPFVCDWEVNQFHILL